MMLSDRTSPEPVVPPIEPRMVAMLVGVALLGGFTVAALLFGVVLDGDDTDSIGAGGQTAAIEQTTITSAAPQMQSDQAAAPLVARTDESPQTSLAVPAAGSETSAETSETSTTTTVATTVTTMATTVTTTTTAPPATEAPVIEAPASTVADPPADPPPSGGDALYQQQVLDLTNAERVKAGCSGVRLDPILNAVADAHSEDMAANNYFDHTGRDGSQPRDRVSAAGYPARGSGENIAQGYHSAEAVVAGWMSSPGHRRNILNCEWTELGVGYAEGRGGGNIPGLYWTQVFAIRR